MRFRDKEKQLLVDVFVKTAEYVLSVIVLGSVISGRFSAGLFLVGIGTFILLVIISLFISIRIKNKEDEHE